MVICGVVGVVCACRTDEIKVICAGDVIWRLAAGELSPSGALDQPGSHLQTRHGRWLDTTWHVRAKE